MIEVEGPDGTIYEFPDDTPEDVMASAMRKEYGGPDESTQGKGILGTIGDVASRANDALLMGAGEEYRAAVKALFGGGGFDEKLDAENARRARIQEERPVVDVLGQTLGLGAQMGTGLAAQGAKLLPGAAQTAMGRIGQAAGTGAVAGGVSGAADTESPLNMPERTVLGMGIGAGTGAGLSAAIEGVGKGIQAYANRAIAPQARVARRMASQGTTADDALLAKRRATEAGVDEYALLDVGADDVGANSGTQIQRLARNVADQPGPGSAKLDKFVDARQRGQFERNVEAVRRNITPISKTPDEVKDGIQETASDLVQPLYEAGRRDVIKINNALKVDLSKPSVKRAWATAQRIAAENGEELEPLFIDGKFNPKLEQAGARTLHRLREALDDLIDSQTKEPAPGVRNTSKLGKAYIATRKRIDAALKGGSLAYKKADKIYSVAQTYRDNLSDGANYNRMSAEDIERYLKSGTKDKTGKAMFRLGSAWNIYNKLASATDSRDLSKLVGFSPKERAKLAALIGDEKRLGKMMEFIKTEREMAKSFEKVVGGSRTSAQMADMSEEGARAVGSAIRSGPYQAVKNGIANIVENMGGMSETERSIIADILTETDDASFAALMKQIAEVQRGQTQARSALGMAGQAATLGIVGDN
jgi:hypothetical protein